MKKILLLVTLLAMGCTNVFAAAFQVLEWGAAMQGTANAGTAVSDDLSSSFLNPAAMQNVLGQGVSVAVTHVQPVSNFTPTFATRGGVDILASSQNKIADNGLFVPQIYYVRPLSEKMRFGFSVTVPYGLETEYPADSATRYFATLSSIHTLNANPALSYQLNPRWSVGGGLNVQYIVADLNSVFAAGANDVRVKNHGDDLGFGWNAGVQYQPLRDLKLGLSYRSKISYDLSGDTSVYAPSAAALAVAAALGIADGKARVKVTLPETAVLSAAYSWSSKIKILGDLHWTRWSRIKEINLFFGPQQRLKQILTKYYDSYRWALGASYQWRPNTTFKLGYAQDQSPVSSRYRTARIPDNDRHWYSAGLGYDYSRAWHVDLAYSYIRIRNSTVDEFDPVLNHAFVASYRTHANLIGLQATYRFA